MSSTVERITTVVSDRSLFEVLGAQPIAGRAFRPDDQLVAVISEPLWRSRFAGDPNVMGRSVTLDDRSFTVVGVMPEAFQFPYGAASVLRSAMTESRVDVWIAEYRPLRGRLSRLIARLKPGVIHRRSRCRDRGRERRRRSLTTGAAAHGACDRRAVCGRRAWPDAPLALAALRCRGAGAHCGVRQRREPAAGAHEQPDAGGRHESRTRRVARAPRAAVHDREPAARACRRSRRRARRAMDEQPAHRVRLRAHSRACTRSRSTGPCSRFCCSCASRRRCSSASRRRWPPGASMPGFVAREAGRATAGRRYGRVRDALVVAEVALAFVLASGAGLVISEMDTPAGSRQRHGDGQCRDLHLGQPMTPGIESQYYAIAERVAQVPGVTSRGIHAGAAAAELGLVEQLDRLCRQGRAAAHRRAVLDRAALCHPGIFPGARHSNPRAVEASRRATPEMRRA